MKRKMNNMKYLIVVLAAIVLLQGKTVYASADNDTTETKKVELNKNVSLANTEKYKDMDYTFLKNFDFGDKQDATICFNTAEILKASDSLRLSEGRIVYTKGFYSVDDGGAAVYEIATKGQAGGIKLENGLWANLVPKQYVGKDGTKWKIINVKQLGATGKGIVEDQNAINAAISLAGTVSAQTDVDRGMVYIPEGEYKCGDKIYEGQNNINVIGDGEKTVLFTDNDYRDEEGYSEFFFEVWGSTNSFLGFFTIEAREVDLYNYMRQLVYVYSKDVYTYQVDTIIPQETYNSYFFEDKQYSNVCCYSGNTNITIDDCKMEQMSGTFRGANFGALDIWAAGEKNITVMNCELYGNARDEQIGFFSRDKDGASVKNVEFINNTIHSVEIKYPEIIGTRTMCMTIAYSDSKNVDGIHIAGNHFIMETDSKLSTFGAITNCVIEKNIIEVKCTNKTWSTLFDSSNNDSKNIMIQNNELYVTSDCGVGRGNIAIGKLTMKNNRIFSDVKFPFGICVEEFQDNDVIFLENLGIVGVNVNCTNNKFTLYNGLGSMGTNREQIVAYGAGENDKYEFSNNIVYSYFRKTDLQIYQSLIKLDGDIKNLFVKNNQFYYPNTRYITTNSDAFQKFEDANGPYYKNDFYRKRSGTYTNIVTENNIAQGVYFPENEKGITYKNNTEKPVPNKLDDNLVSTVKIRLSGKDVNEITTINDSVDLDDVEFQVDKQDENGNVLSEKEITGKKVAWYSGVNGIATVDEKGVVKRQLYGDAHIYAVPLDGSGKFAECIVHFAKKKAASVEGQKEIQLEPGLKMYANYQVMPKEAEQTLIWSSDNTAVVKVKQNGMIEGIAEGNANITGMTTDGSGQKIVIRVSVNKLSVKKIKFEQKYLYFGVNEIGQKKQLKVEGYYPTDAKNAGIKLWKSMDESIATVDQNGNVTAKKSGIAIIRAYSMDMKCFGSCNVYIQFPKVQDLVLKEYTNTYAYLTWKPYEKCYGYYIYQWDETKKEWVALNEGNYIKETEFKVENLSKNTKYKFSVRAFISNWDTGERILYESEDNIQEVKTLSYTPVTKLKPTSNMISLVEEQEFDFGIDYSPNTDNYDKLAIDATIKNSNVAKVVSQVQKSGSKTIHIKAVNYGVTNMRVVSNDAWGLELNIPIGVVTKKQVSKTTVNSNPKGISIEFDALENEAAYLKKGAITGYMIRRTKSIQFSDLKYIEATGKSSYLYMDVSAEPEQKYTYTVTPCIKNEDNYFLGYGSGNYTTSMQTATKAKSIKMEKELYVVNKGEKQEIKTKITPEEVYETRLDWSVQNAKIAKVKRVEKNEDGCDFAQVIGLSVGGTRVESYSTDGSELTASAVLVVTPEQVMNINSNDNEGERIISWAAMKGVAGYKVFKKSEQGEWKLVSKQLDNYYFEQIEGNEEIVDYRICGYIVFEGKEYDGINTDFVIGLSSDGKKQIIDIVSNTSTTEEPGTPGQASTSNNIDNEKSYQIGITRISGYDSVYDGEIHDAVSIIQNQNGDRYYYSVDGELWTRQVPFIKNVVDSKYIYICLIRNNEKKFFRVYAKVVPKSINEEKISLSNNEVYWNGNNQYPKVICRNSEVSYTVQYDGTCQNVGTYKVTIKGNGNYKDTIILDYQIVLNSEKIYENSSFKYKMSGANRVKIYGIKSRNIQSIVIPTTVIIGGKKMTIDTIGENAFKNCKKLKKLQVGKNICYIEKNACLGCKKLNKVIFDGDKVKKIEKNAWKNISANATFYVSKELMKSYKKLCSSKTGFGKKMKWKKYVIK